MDVDEPVFEHDRFTGAAVSHGRVAGIWLIDFTKDLFSDCLDFTDDFPSHPFVEFNTKSAVSKVLACVSCLEAPPFIVIDIMYIAGEIGLFVFSRYILKLCIMVDCGLEFTVHVLDSAIVRRIIRWAIEWNDTMIGHDVLDFMAVEVRAIIDLEKQGCSESAAKPIEMIGNLLSAAGGAQ